MADINVTVAQNKAINISLGKATAITFQSKYAGIPSPVPYIDFKLNDLAVAWKEGRVFYCPTDRSLAVYNDDASIKMNLGQEVWVRIKNLSGQDLQNGDVVRPSGSTGDNPTAVLAQGDTYQGSRPVGVVTHKINKNAIGYVTLTGRVRNLDTTQIDGGAAEEGDILYVHPTVRGGKTAIKPAYPNWAFRVGVLIRKHQSEGIIMVYPGTELDSYTTGAVMIANGNGEIAQDYPAASWDHDKKELSVDNHRVRGEYSQAFLSADPADPEPDNAVEWFSDGTESGDAGDKMQKINVGGVVKIITLVDYSTH